MKFHAILFLLLAPALFAAPPAVTSFHKTSDGVLLQTPSGVLRLQVWSDQVVRVTYGLGKSLPPLKSLAVISKPEHAGWKLAQTADAISLSTKSLVAQVDRQTGTVQFFDASNHLLLAESPGSRALTPNKVAAFDVLASRQSFVLAPGEAIYGLGQHQQGLMNYRGHHIRLLQENREIAIPMLVSSRGYGLFWDNPAVTGVDAGMPENEDLLTWNSEAADAVDYYFMAGPELDDVIASYRRLTGAVPMMGEWAWGFWQCRERYASQQELLDVVRHYREMGVPLDGIIQDWQYWTPAPWGSHEFDPKRYPDPAGLFKQLHAEHVHALISVWPKFDVGCSNAVELARAGALYSQVIPYVYPKGRGRWYDPFSAAGRRVYWKQISEQLFSRGVDGWWLDASEAELSGKWGEFRGFNTADGPGAKVFNAYPLMHTTGVYEGQRAGTSAKRVFILTRSAYAGQQRNAAVAWSGDIQGNWDVFRKQIPAGLNFTASGIPYWNTDIGGFFGGNPADPKYAELFTRWFQFGAFCPMFRVHGTSQPKEMWRFDEATQNILIACDRLRYHLLPYIYSVSWQVTDQGYTMMRPLVMDFRADTNVFSIPDQFLFGPALMVCPVTQAKAVNRNVYLPAGTAWTDFWTGKTQPGGQILETASPIETLPLFVRAGSIIPFGPAIEYAAQSADPMELRVYPGADGSFTLYEDEGDNYNYERGVRATIPISWDEKSKTLTLGKRSGKFPGMLKQRTFRIVFVSPGHGVGGSVTEKADIEVIYTGLALKISAR
jgi:alpha-D-xyloside xylohydrolase